MNGLTMAVDGGIASYQSPLACALDPGTNDGRGILNYDTWGAFCRVGSPILFVARHLAESAVVSQPTVIAIVQCTLSPAAESVAWIKEATGLSDRRIADLLGVSRTTLDAWSNGGTLREQHRQHLFAVEDVIRRAQRHSPSQEQLAAWLDTPRGGYGRTPAELLKSRRYDTARALAVSRPSARLVRPPSWVDRPVPPAFQSGAEIDPEAIPPEFGRE